MADLKLGKVNSIENFLNYLIDARTCLHLHHWSENSYAKHVALEEIYTELLELLDQLVETEQVNRKLTLQSNGGKINSDSITYVQEVLNYVRKYRSIFPHSFQQNILDEIEALLSKGIYKLKFLQ